MPKPMLTQKGWRGALAKCQLPKCQLGWCIGVGASVAAGKAAAGKAARQLEKMKPKGFSQEADISEGASQDPKDRYGSSGTPNLQHPSISR